MNAPIKQHYVPQSYLRFFAQKRKTIWETMVVDKKICKPYLANIRDVAFEKNFYTIERLGEQKYAYEKFYAEQVEPLISRTFGQLISSCTAFFSKDKDIVINNDIRSKLSIIIIAQLLRTRKARDYLYDISKEMFPTELKNIVEKVNPTISPEEKKQLLILNLDDFFKEIDVRIITDVDRIKKFAKIIYNKCWIVYRNNDYKNNPFVTSDHPVVQFNTNSASNSLIDNGIAKVNTVIHYPINSQLMLAMYNKLHYLIQSIDDMDGRLLFLNVENDSAFVDKINQMQYEQCTQHVFSKPFT